MIDARVVVLPEPVGPVTRMSPFGRFVSSPMIGGNPSSSKLKILKGIVRIAPATAPRCTKKFARKRESPFTVKLRSSSFSFSKWIFCSSFMTE